MDIRTDEKFDGQTLMTANQWRLKKKMPLDNCGIELYCNAYRQHVSTYYRPEEVRDMVEEELLQLQAEQRTKRTKQKERRLKREQAKREQELELAKQEIEGTYKFQQFISLHNLAKSFMKYFDKIPSAQCDIPSGTIAIDTETTGLNFDYDEIIQLSIVDIDGGILFNSYIKPYWNSEWSEAQRINGISPDMVNDSPYPHEIISKLKGIFEAANTIIAYNAEFDLTMLEKWGFDLYHDASNRKIVDVMIEYAAVNGEWSDYYGDFVWQKLIHCASHYGFHDYAQNAHDSLADAIVTMNIYKKMVENGEIK